MDMKKILICGIIALIWCISEILCIKVYENVSEIHDPPFTIDTSSKNKQMEEQIISQPIPLFLPAQSQTNNFNPNQPTTENLVKAQLLVADNQKLQSYNSMVIRNNTVTKKELKETTTQNPPERKKQQVLQIPPLLSPLATSDPKSTNSSKRQTEDILDSDKRFIPSQELGSFDSSEGFVPHVFHEPKTVSFSQPTYLPPIKPIKHDANYGFTFGESRLPVSAQKDMEAFEHDFEDLKAKYPELNDLVSNYPIMEEIMKQKLAERFQMNYYSKQKPPPPQFSDSDNKYKGKFSGNEQSQEFYGGFKFPSDTSGGKDQQGGYPKSKERPYAFDMDKIKWNFSVKRPSSEESSTETSYPVPAGGFYQEPKLPTSFYGYDDKNHTYGSAKYPSSVDTKHKAPSPWKKVLHLITAFLPVGILISALTPNVINISSVPNKNNYPIRQRSLSGKQDMSVSESGALIDLLDERIQESLKNYEEDPECDERNFCDMSRRGKESNASAIEKIFWKLAQSTPEDVAEIVGMKRLFRAIKLDKCVQFKCKRQNDDKKQQTKQRKKKSIGNDPYNLHGRDEEMIRERYASALNRQKRAKNKLSVRK